MRKRKYPKITFIAVEILRQRFFSLVLTHILTHISLLSAPNVSKYGVWINRALKQETIIMRISRKHWAPLSGNPSILMMDVWHVICRTLTKWTFLETILRKSCPAFFVQFVYSYTNKMRKIQEMDRRRGNVNGEISPWSWRRDSLDSKKIDNIKNDSVSDLSLPKMLSWVKWFSSNYP